MAVAPLIEESGSGAGGGVCLLKSAPTTGGTGEKLILVKSVGEPTELTPGESDVRPATPSTNGGDGAAFEDPETASNAASTEGGMPSPTKKRTNGNGNGTGSQVPLLPEEEKPSSSELSTSDADQQEAAPTKTIPACSAAKGEGSSAPAKETEKKGDIMDPAKSAAVPSPGPAPPVTEKEDAAAAGNADDPSTAKWVSKLEKLEADLETQLAKAGAMQKRAWRNKHKELLESFDELCAAASPERRSVVLERLEKVGAQLEGTPKPAKTSGVVAAEA